MPPKKRPATVAETGDGQRGRKVPRSIRSKKGQAAKQQGQKGLGKRKGGAQENLPRTRARDARAIQTATIQDNDEDPSRILTNEEIVQEDGRPDRQGRDPTTTEEASAMAMLRRGNSNSGSSNMEGGTDGDNRIMPAPFMPLADIVRVVKEVLETATPSNNAWNDGNARLATRLTPSNKLPEFSGKLADYRHSKTMVEATSREGAYTETENFSRIFAALKGEARDAVAPLLATGSDSTAIMKALDRKYGNTNALARQLVNGLNELRAVKLNRRELAHFTNTISTTVAALKSLDQTGYLHNPDIVRAAIRKLPSNLQYSFNEFVMQKGNEVSGLERLSEFMEERVDAIAAGGLFEDDEPETIPAKPTGEKRRPIRAENSFILTEDAEPAKDKVGNKCGLCKRGEHHPSKCAVFGRMRVSER